MLKIENEICSFADPNTTKSQKVCASEERYQEAQYALKLHKTVKLYVQLGSTNLFFFP